MYKRTEENKNKKSFMQELDEWTDAHVVRQLGPAFEDCALAEERDVPKDEAYAEVEAVVAEVKKAIREKVLDSYKNGLKAQPKRERKDWR